jgi:hypothetical protein
MEMPRKYIGGDIVGGDKITTIVSAATRIPTTLIEKAEETVLDASDLAFSEARDLLKALRHLRKAKAAKNETAVKLALEELEAIPGSRILVAFISELKKGD